MQFSATIGFAGDVHGSAAACARASDVPTTANTITMLTATADTRCRVFARAKGFSTANRKPRIATPCRPSLSVHADHERNEVLFHGVLSPVFHLPAAVSSRPRQ